MHSKNMMQCFDVRSINILFRMFFPVVLFSSVVFSHSYASAECESVTENKSPEYYLTAVCQRSTLKFLAQRDYDTLDECKKFAIRTRGMAFNFGEPSRLRKKMSKSENDFPLSCIVFACPEIENSTSIVYDPRYDYFTLFGNPIPPPNSSCVENVGVFVFHLLRVNYSTAESMCQNFGGILADIATEDRTEKLSDLLKHTMKRNGFKQIYVGMNDLEVRGTYARSNGQLLSCTTYRAWAPGHPKRTRRCITLDSNRMWRSTNCSTRSFFLCEIYPSGWNDYYDDNLKQFCEILQ